jgi:polar amino acid transport system substrate-binding protein
MNLVKSIILCGFLLFSIIYSITVNATSIKFLTHSAEGSIFTDTNYHTRGIKHAGRRAFYVELVHNMMKITGHSEPLVVGNLG